MRHVINCILINKRQELRPRGGKTFRRVEVGGREGNDLCERESKYKKRGTLKETERRTETEG